jgi:hypothetical protein
MSLQILALLMGFCIGNIFQIYIRDYKVVKTKTKKDEEYTK